MLNVDVDLINLDLVNVDEDIRLMPRLTPMELRVGLALAWARRGA